jgi:hypothetical protein
MVIFNSYVKLPEGNINDSPIHINAQHSHQWQRGKNMKLQTTNLSFG